ncbi:hypothetical protein TSOC_006187 [Tetrabaena socialis]|uniref:Uncharacterized protein n=1 Tax=Tetrabaena socialis TaxID=47790 RepID=A0A2J8A4B7_9CHLO|nr:hypothetical protein TSOC_006187 [Tetrabaena socialis]|eukprot:PNH07359.1 hypothetical protein TSOC_006187 [Tetrabaena socialis]
MEAHQLVWDVVCLAALSAMEFGRRLLYRRRPPVGGPPCSIIRVSAETVADFLGPATWVCGHGTPATRMGGGEVIFCGPPDVDSPRASP